VSALPQIVELNIGHFLVGEAIFVGLAEAIRRMREAMEQGRAGASTQGPPREPLTPSWTGSACSTGSVSSLRRPK
jgi:hypothetical protein